MRGAVVILGDFGGHLGLFTRMINNFMRVAHPTTLGLVDLVGVKMFIFRHIIHYSILCAKSQEGKREGLILGPVMRAFARHFS